MKILTRRVIFKTISGSINKQVNEKLEDLAFVVQRLQVDMAQVIFRCLPLGSANIFITCPSSANPVAKLSQELIQ